MPGEAEGIAFFEWVESSGSAHFFRQSTWLYPIVEIIHITGFAVLVGAAVLFDLRLLGVSKQLPVKDVMNHLLTWVRISFLAVLPSGLILFSVDAVAMAANPAFLLKMGLLGLAAVNAAFFHLVVVKTVDEWNVAKTSPLKAKITGFLSIVLWFSVITCGRFIAYT